MMREEINKWIAAKNTARENGNNVVYFISKTKISRTRKKMKNELRSLVRDWWDEKLQECQEAADTGDFEAKYSLLKQLGTRSSKPTEGTTITGEQFRAHFFKISSERYESNPTDFHRTVEDAPDRRKDYRFRNAAEKHNEIPSFKEIEEAILEVKDFAHGADKVRIRYMWNATPELKVNVIHLVQEMFATGADKWEQSAKVGQIVSLFKKGDRQNCGNYRGVCLFSMIS